MTKRVALVAIDIQVGYTLPGATFEVPGAANIVAGVNDLALRARACDAPVIWITREVRPQVGPGRRTRRRYGGGDENLVLALGSPLDPRLHLDARDVVLTKPRQSGFYASELDSDLRNLDCESVVLVGFTTNVCVLATARDASARDYDVTVVSDLTASLPVVSGGHQKMSAQAVHDAALAFVEHGVGQVLDSGAVSFEAA